MSSKYKIAGCCTTCDTAVYEVLAVYEAHHERAGEPKATGKPIGNAVRIGFGLYDGTRADLTFCEECALQLEPSQYVEIWRKVLRSWMREQAQDEKHKKWFLPQFANGLLAELGRVLLQDIEA